MGGPPVPVNLVSQNVGPNQSLPVNGRIELGFDRLLLPASVSRQTFVLQNAGGTIPYTPTIAYDPVARIVTITPLADQPNQPFTVGQSYNVIIVPPGAPADPNGLRAIDGATLKGGLRQIEFSVTAATAPPPDVRIDFCRDIAPITSGETCALPMCHGAPTPAAGLELYPTSGISQTAVGRVSQGSNTGPRSVASPPTLLFAEDMPIIDANGSTTGDPGNSWLMYKVLLAIPSPEPVDAGEPNGPEAGEEDAGMQGAPDATIEGGGIDAGASAVDAGAVDGGVAEGGSPEGGAAPVVVPPVDVSGAHGPFALTTISVAERATLSNYILGREMPFPPPPALLNPSTAPLTLSELERLSLWISQGAAAPASPCP